MNLAKAADLILRLSHADGCLVIASERQLLNLRWANNSLTSNGLTSTQELAVVAVIAGAVGVASTTLVQASNLEALVREAEARAFGKPPAEDLMPLAGGDANSPDWYAPVPTPDVSVLAPLVPQLDHLFTQAKADNNRLFGYAEHLTTTKYVATSMGARQRFLQTAGTFALNAKSQDMQCSTWEGIGVSDFATVNLESIYSRLVTRLSWSKVKLDLPAGRYDTLLSPSAVSDMLTYTYWSSSARDAAEGKTVFSVAGGGTRVGELIYDPRVELYSDPLEPGLETIPFFAGVETDSNGSVFDSGVALSRTTWVKAGRLQHLLTPRWWANKTGIEPSPFVSNLVMPSDGPGLDAMIKQVSRGLLVTCLWYIRSVDPQTLLLTGLTRDGVFLIEDGVVKGAVNNFRFNMSPIDLLSQIKAMGQSVPTLGREFGDEFPFVKFPPLLIEDFNMSSVSQAI